MDLEKIITLIGVMGVYVISALQLYGLYWPLKIEYEGHPKRRLFQKTNAFLSAIMATIALLGVGFFWV